MIGENTGKGHAIVIFRAGSAVCPFDVRVNALSSYGYHALLHGLVECRTELNDPN
jgi:hypothetical protein